MEQELKATYWNGAKNLISTTVYSIACKFDAFTEQHPHELHFGYNMELQPNAPQAFLGIKLLFFLQGGNTYGADALPASMFLK